MHPRQVACHSLMLAHLHLPLLVQHTFTEHLLQYSNSQGYSGKRNKVFRVQQGRYKQAQQLGSEFLFNCMDGRDGYDDPFFLSYGKYRQRVIRVIENLKLDPSHKSHDGRKTFVTNAKKSLLEKMFV